MTKKSIYTQLVLKPASTLYGWITTLRNKFFDWGILKEHKFPVPVIVVGNLRAGGTGKTPHVEYILDQLRYTYHIGVLSRGYKRETKGFIAATRHSTPKEIGDEPYQIYRKFNRDVTVAVCEDRCKGIQHLMQLDPAINLVVLDDAFQHRYVKPSVSILLTEYARPFFDDKMLPLGRLRESVRGKNRADIVIVTKCPEQMTPLEYRNFTTNLDLFPYQKLFFSKIINSPVEALFPDQATHLPYLDWLTENDAVLVVCGIGNPIPFVKYVKGFKAKVKLQIYNDHHPFAKKDLLKIQKRFEDINVKNKYIITTEKDAVKLIDNPNFPEELKPYIFYVPVHVEFDRQDNATFEETLRKFITTSQR